MATSPPPLLDEDYELLGNNYLAGLGVNRIDSGDGQELKIGQQRSNRDISIGTDTNTGELVLQSGTGGVSIRSGGDLDLESTGYGTARLTATGPGAVEVIASAGSVKVDAGPAASVEIGTETAAAVAIGRTGSVVEFNGSLQSTDGVLYLGDRTSAGARFRWDEAQSKVVLETTSGSDVWVWQSEWHTS